MKFKFYLGSVSKKSSDKTAMIYLYVREGASKKGISNTIKIPIDKRIKPRLWNKKKQCPKKGATGERDINEELANTLSKAEKLKSKLLESKTTLSLSEMKREFEKVISHKFIAPERLDFDKAKNEFVKFKKLEMTETYAGRFTVLFNILDDYSDHTKAPISFDTFDKAFYSRFLNYLLNTRDHNNNTAGKTIKLLKSFLFWCHENEHIKTDHFKKYKIISNPIDIIALSETELMNIFNMDLSDNPRLDKVRDIFCIECFTGVRISDIQNMKWNDIDLKLGKWKILTKKTNQFLTVQLNDYALAILNKYKGQSSPLPKISDQKLNLYIKELAEKAKIETPITVRVHKGKKITESTEPKYKLISTHTGRRSFITLSLKNGLRPELVMSIVGHTSFQTMQKYIAVTDEEKHEAMKKVWSIKPEMKIVS